MSCIGFRVRAGCSRAGAPRGPAAKTWGRSRRFDWSNCIRSPAVRTGSQDIKLAAISQRIFRGICGPMSALGLKRPYGHVASNVRFARKQSSSGDR